MINQGLQKYEVVLGGQYFLRELLATVTLEDSLSEIAYRANVDMVFTEDFPGISTGQSMRVSGVPFGGSAMEYLLHPGVVWECDSKKKGQKRLQATVYDLSIYLAKSEDEYLLPAGQTASDRLKIYAADWEIPLGTVEGTGVPLDRALQRQKPIWSIIMDDLKETVAKGGEMYRPRMTPDGLSLIKIGSNETVWVLEENQDLEEISQKRTLEGAVTRVKVIGHAKENQRSPVLAIVEGETAKYGTLQKVITYDKSSTSLSARTTGELHLSGEQETFTVQGIDINTVRAGDKIMLNELELIVASIRHNLGSPGSMTAELASADQVRRQFYGPV